MVKTYKHFKLKQTLVKIFIINCTDTTDDQLNLDSWTYNTSMYITITSTDIVG